MGGGYILVMCVCVGVAGWGACLCCLLACVHAYGLYMWMGMYASMWCQCAFVHTCGLCVWMGEWVHAYSVCECPYMWFMCVDEGGGACIQCL